jgi:hypothetical protein
MAVSKTITGNNILLIGTSAEVSQALSDEQVSPGKIVAIFYNGTNISAIYRIV